jgi:hypothetical protein
MYISMGVLLCPCMCVRACLSVCVWQDHHLRRVRDGLSPYTRFVDQQLRVLAQQTAAHADLRARVKAIGGRIDEL